MRHQSAGGFTLIELVIYIVISSIALVGVLSLFQQAGARTAEAMERRKAQEIAAMLLEEIQLMPFTFCEPSDPNARTANAEADCSIAQGLAPTPGQTRGGSVPYNHVGDYNGYTVSPPMDSQGNTIPGLSGYQLSVAVVGSAQGGLSASDLVRITVTLTGPYGSESLVGYRARHSPNATP